MEDAALLLARSIKLLAEVAIFAALGEWCLGKLLGPRRAANPFHAVLHATTLPLRKVVAWLLPARLPTGWRVFFVAALLAAIWVGALAWKVALCRTQGGCA